MAKRKSKMKQKGKAPKGVSPEMAAAAQQGSQGGPFAQAGPPGGGMPGRPM